MTPLPADTRPTAPSRRPVIVLFCAICLASLASLSAHVIKGVGSAELATAFVSSPSAGADPLVRLAWGGTDTGLRVACFNTANTSPERPDRPGWPRVTGVGFELPGSLSGFSLLAPLDGDWELVEGARASIPGHGSVTLDVAIMARENPKRWKHGRRHELRGIPPGQTPVRGSGTRFCVSGPFPDTALDVPPSPIEKIIDGVVVGFQGVDRRHHGNDVGVWFPAPPGNVPRLIPLYQ